MLPFVEPNLTSAARSAVGFLLVDSSLQLLYGNEEAFAILGYPESLERPVSLDVVIEKIRPLVVAQNALGFTKEPGRPFEILSGRRRYRLRIFSVKSWTRNSRGPAMVVLLERGQPGFIDISRIAHRFRFTQRECEAVRFSIQGFPTKDIATRMSISSNTVKTLLKFAMLKVGVSTRSAMIATILDVAGHRLPSKLG